MKAKSRPDALTAFQSMLPWNSETSMPSTVAGPWHTTTALELSASGAVARLQAASANSATM